MRLLPKWVRLLVCEVIGHKTIEYVGAWRWCMRHDGIMGPNR